MTPDKAQPTPQLKGIPEEAAQEIRNLSQIIYRLSSRLTALESSGFLTMQQAESLYSPQRMAQELQATGSAPLNVVTVGGRPILQAQPTKARKV